MSARAYLEGQIIGGALFSPANALQVIDTLSPANFKDPDNRQILSTIAEQAKVGDLSFPQIVLRYQRDKAKTYVLTQRMDAFHGTAVLPLALELLEIDMREKFVAELLRLETDKSKAEAFEIAAAIKQTRDYISHAGNDIFPAVDQVSDYLRAYLAPEELAGWDTLRSAIPKVVDRIKTRARTQTFLQQLLSLPASADSHNQKTCLTIVTEITASLLSRKDIPQHVVAKLSDLKINLWETPTKSSPFPNF